MAGENLEQILNELQLFQVLREPTNWHNKEQRNRYLAVRTDKSVSALRILVVPTRKEIKTSEWQLFRGRA